jgi:hypothetical protein
MHSAIYSAFISRLQVFQDGYTWIKVGCIVIERGSKLSDYRMFPTLTVDTESIRNFKTVNHVIRPLVNKMWKKHGRNKVK